MQGEDASATAAAPGAARSTGSSSTGGAGPKSHCSAIVYLIKIVYRSVRRHYRLIHVRNVVVSALPTVVALVCLQGLSSGAKGQGAGRPVLRAAA